MVVKATYATQGVRTHPEGEVEEGGVGGAEREGRLCVWRGAWAFIHCMVLGGEPMTWRCKMSAAPEA